MNDSLRVWAIEDIGYWHSQVQDFFDAVACLESDAAASGLAAIPWRISLEQALFAGKQCERPDGTASRYFGGAVASGQRTPEP